MADEEILILRGAMTHDFGINPCCFTADYIFTPDLLTLGGCEKHIRGRIKNERERIRNNECKAYILAWAGESEVKGLAPENLNCDSRGFYYVGTTKIDNKTVQSFFKDKKKKLNAEIKKKKAALENKQKEVDKKRNELEKEILKIRIIESNKELKELETERRLIDAVQNDYLTSIKNPSKCSNENIEINGNENTMRMRNKIFEHRYSYLDKIGYEIYDYARHHNEENKKATRRYLIYAAEVSDVLTREEFLGGVSSKCDKSIQENVSDPELLKETILEKRKIRRDYWHYDSLKEKKEHEYRKAKEELEDAIIRGSDEQSKIEKLSIFDAAKKEYNNQLEQPIILSSRFIYYGRNAPEIDQDIVEILNPRAGMFKLFSTNTDVKEYNQDTHELYEDINKRLPKVGGIFNGYPCYPIPVSDKSST